MAYSSRQETDHSSRIVKIMQQDKRREKGQEKESYIIPRRWVLEQSGDDRRWVILQER
jgi:hypothetical protein